MIQESVGQVDHSQKQPPWGRTDATADTHVWTTPAIQEHRNQAFLVALLPPRTNARLSCACSYSFLQPERSGIDVERGLGLVWREV